ncbi:hypothetical protein PN462_20415 [Spirulina sp. CS-785/01]|uniref:hypothetical protein n=1 Tax=Spirulina sp. CS-785/01 TaxID=3021716 RepID=UPI00232F2533|nr:hypothetical protein [Spirulina sp. CS-785/01]MDB9315489.1 hypothetical protein [Spirulina sp. CS-785/01]
MTDLDDLLNQLATQEAQLGEQEFLAPCVRGGKVQTKIANLVYTFTPYPADFEGWGIFIPRDRSCAEVVDEANLPQLAEYLHLFPRLRLHLAYALRGQTWLAYPVNESDMQQRFQTAQPVAVHLVSEGAQFEPIVARFDGTAYWFETVDRRADVQLVAALREALTANTLPPNVQFAGITPEMRTVYELVWQQTEEGQRQLRHRQQVREGRRNRRRETRQPQTPETRLREALHQGGGQLREFRDRGEFWLVQWTTHDGTGHTSAIAKSDLTVMSAGICLSGRDRDFDLQSLVGVVLGNGN